MAEDMALSLGRAQPAGPLRQSEGETWFYRHDPFGRRLTKVRKLNEREVAWTASKHPNFVGESARDTTEIWNWPEPPRGAGMPHDVHPPAVGTHFTWDGDVVAEGAPLYVSGSIGPTRPAGISSPAASDLLPNKRQSACFSTSQTTTSARHVRCSRKAATCIGRRAHDLGDGEGRLHCVEAGQQLRTCDPAAEDRMGSPFRESIQRQAPTGFISPRPTQ